MSTPCKRFCFIGEAPASSSNICTGRKFANTPSSARSASRPCSGLIFAFGSDHFGPPTAPSNTASLSRQLAMVSSGNGLLTESIAAPPISCSEKRKLCPNDSPMRVRTRVPSLATSGPIPSPARTVIRASRIWSPRIEQFARHAAAGNRAGLFLQADNNGQSCRSDTRRRARQAM